MVPRFTVIQGGLSEGTTAELAQARPPAGATGHRDGIALAWNRDVQICGGPVRAAAPAEGRHPLGDGWTRPRPLADAEARALVARAAAEAADRALRARFAAPGRSIGIVGAVAPIRAQRPVYGAGAYGSVLPRTIPRDNLIGVRPAGWAPPAVETGALGETVGGIAARTPQRPIAGQPRKTPLRQMVHRVFGQRNALKGAFLRRAGAIVTRTVHPGDGAASMPWRRARA